MSDAEQLTIVARERADKIMDQAIGELRAAAKEIGTRLGIPENIAGHSIEELLGRMTYVPSMSRDLRRVCGQELAKLELDALFKAPPVVARPATRSAPPPPPPPAPVAIPPSVAAKVVPVGLDVGDLQGVTVQSVKALRAAGLHKVGDLLNVPDEHLVKINGLGEKSVAQIRIAIAKAAGAAA